MVLVRLVYYNIYGLGYIMLLVNSSAKRGTTVTEMLIEDYIFNLCFF